MNIVYSVIPSALLACIFIGSTLHTSDHLAIAAQSPTVAPNSTLTPLQSAVWSSPKNTFQLKFYSRSPDDSLYSVGILYKSIAIQTVAWTAGGNVAVGKNAAFELTQDGDLVLRDLSSGLIPWRSNTNNSGVVGAVMQDDGNFVLLNSSGDNIWESFDNPSDTLLPNQQLTVGKSLQPSSTNTSATVYTAVMESSGNLSLKWQNQITYWGSATDSNATVPRIAKLDNSQGSLTLVASANVTVRSYISSDYTDSTILYRRVTLDADGNLRLYGWSSGGSSWIAGWQAVQDQCDVYGLCGPFGVCSYDTTGNYTCGCPDSTGFVAVDTSDPRKGCQRARNLSKCNESNNMVKMDHTVLLNFPSNDSTYNSGENACRQNCLNDVFCFAALVRKDGSGTCVFKRQDSASGYQYSGLTGTSFFKVCGNPSPRSLNASSPQGSSVTSKTLRISIVASVLGTLAAAILLQAGLWFCFCRNDPRFGRHASQYALLDYASGAPVQFSFKDLQVATHNFRDKLGVGGFGAVYKGVLPNKSEVAVKRLEGVGQGEKHFRMEVATIGSTHHMNLVRLCGFCAEGKHRMLVYEYMKNCSLDRFLFEVSSEVPKLEWEARFNIILGAARGITYLHQECRDCIIHCDIKPENILLDDNFVAKVSDFGLAKLTDVKERARTVTTVRGTRGYLAPEWRSNLPITVKSDVFSFGMVVLEVVSGRRNFDTSVSSERRRFSEWAYKEYFEEGNGAGVVDERLLAQGVNWEEIDKAMKVAFWCMQGQPSLRPSMSKVVQILEGTIAAELPPLPLFFAAALSPEDIAQLGSRRYAALQLQLQHEEEELQRAGGDGAQELQLPAFSAPEETSSSYPRSGSPLPPSFRYEYSGPLESSTFSVR